MLLALPSTAPIPSWVPNGPVTSIVRFAGRTIAVGSFTGWAPPNGPLVRVTLSDGAVARPMLPKVAGGSVKAIEPDGSGGWYIGGGFSSVGGARRGGLAHVQADGTVDPAFHPSVKGFVGAISATGSTVYVGGLFTAIDGVARRNLAAFDAVGTSLTTLPQADGWVTSLVADGATVYVGGHFHAVGGVARSGLAAIAGTTLTSFDPAPDGWVNAMAIDPGRLYIAGAFTHAGGAGRPGLAEIDTASGAATGWLPVLDSVTYGDDVPTALAIDAGALFVVSADPNTHGQSTILALARTDARIRWRKRLNGEATSVDVRAGVVYTGGGFTTIDDVERGGAAALDGLTGALTAWNPGVVLARGQSDLVIVRASSDGIVIGGNVAGVGTEPHAGLVALDSKGRPMAWAPLLDGAAADVATDGSRLWLLGTFTEVDGRKRLRLAAFGRDLTLLGVHSADVPVFPVDGRLALVGRRVVVITLDGLGRQLITAFATTNGVRIRGWGPPASISDGARSLLFGGGRLLALGRFGTTRRWHGIAELDPATGDVIHRSSIDSAFAAHVTGAVIAGDVLYATLDRKRRPVVAFNLRTRKVLPWVAAIGSTTAGVASIAIQSKVVYVLRFTDDIHGWASAYAVASGRQLWNASVGTSDASLFATGSGIDVTGCDYGDLPEGAVCRPVFAQYR